MDFPRILLKITLIILFCRPFHPRTYKFINIPNNAQNGSGGDVEENYFYKQAKFGTLTYTPNIWLKKFHLGLTASEEVLKSRAIKDGGSPWRVILMEVCTSKKKKRVELPSGDCGNSPQLKNHCEG